MALLCPVRSQIKKNILPRHILRVLKDSYNFFFFNSFLNSRWESLLVQCQDDRRRLQTNLIASQSTIDCTRDFYYLSLSSRAVRYCTPRDGNLRSSDMLHMSRRRGAFHHRQRAPPTAREHRGPYFIFNRDNDRGGAEERRGRGARHPPPPPPLVINALQIRRPEESRSRTAAVRPHPRAKRNKWNESTIRSDIADARRREVALVLLPTTRQSFRDNRAIILSGEGGGWYRLTFVRTVTKYKSYSRYISFEYSKASYVPSTDPDRILNALVCGR